MVSGVRWIKRAFEVVVVSGWTRTVTEQSNWPLSRSPSDSKASALDALAVNSACAKERRKSNCAMDSKEEGKKDHYNYHSTPAH